MFTQLYLELLSRRDALEEKTFLIALFVIATIISLTPLGQASPAGFNR